MTISAKDILEETRQQAIKEGVARYGAFVQALKYAVTATTEPGRLTMLFKIGGAALSPGENGEAWMLLSLATADSTYEPLLAAFRDMIKLGAVHSVEHMANLSAGIAED